MIIILIVLVPLVYYWAWTWGKGYNSTREAWFLGELVSQREWHTKLNLPVDELDAKIIKQYEDLQKNNPDNWPAIPAWVPGDVVRSQAALRLINKRFFVAWCSTGCKPYIFSTKELAEEFMSKELNKHFQISELGVDEGDK